MMRTAKTYDSFNWLQKIESTTGGRPVSSHTYGLNQANQRTKRTDADGSYWDYGYDSLGQAVELLVSGVDSISAPRKLGGTGEVEVLTRQGGAEKPPLPSRAWGKDGTASERK